MHIKASVLISAILACLLVVPARAGSPEGDSLKKIRQQGRIRHLGVPYARFVTGSGDGLDVELVQAFARHLNLAYEFVPTTWEKGLGDLTGKEMTTGRPVPVKGDILACGMTILEWRKKQVFFSKPTFPSQVWLIARADHPLSPIRPGPDLKSDISRVKTLVRGHRITGVAYTCLDPALYGLDAAGAEIHYFDRQLNELAPAVINQEAGLALMDVPDALVALEKWPGQIKILGPVSSHQRLAAAMRPDDQALTEAFNRFFEVFRRDGRYQVLVEKYYPDFLRFYPGFFSLSEDHPSAKGETR